MNYNTITNYHQTEQDDECMIPGERAVRTNEWNGTIISAKRTHMLMSNMRIPASLMLPTLSFSWN
jgi:hypothetical protein